MKQIDGGGGPRKDRIRVPDPAGILEYVKSHLHVVLIAAVLVGVLVYAVASASGDKPDPGTEPGPSGGTESSDTAAPGPESGTATGASKQDPFNGLDILPDGDGYVGDGFQQADSYWCITPRTREKWHMLYVPYGWSAQPVTGGIRIKPVDFDENATDAEPITFWWDVPVCFDTLQERGRYDILSDRPSEDYDEDVYTVVDYYMYDDGLGSEWPVYVIEHVRGAASDSEYAEDLDEYMFYVAKPFANGDADLFFVGTVRGDGFASMSTPRFRTVESLVREMFPPSSDPGFPAEWDEWWAGAQDAPTDGAPDESQSAGTEAEPGTEPDGGDAAEPESGTEP